MLIRFSTQVSGTKGEARKKKNLLVPSVPKQEISDTESVSEAGSDGTDGKTSFYIMLSSILNMIV
jgi:hypothetical protein